MQNKALIPTTSIFDLGEVNTPHACCGKKKCCKKYQRKGKHCKKCPIL